MTPDNNASTLVARVLLISQAIAGAGGWLLVQKWRR